MNPKARRKSRKLVLQALYQWAMTNNPPLEIISVMEEEPDYKKSDQEYFRKLFLGVIENCQDLDKLMEPFLDRSIDSLTPIETAILRLALYELKFCLDVPYKVVINEALELAKQFGATDGFKYVNGILDKVAKQVRSAEMN